MRKWFLPGGLAIVVLVAAVAVSRRQEIWLTVPAELRGAVVYADGREVATVDDPSLTFMEFWFPKSELRVEKAGYKPVRLSLARGTKHYPQVTKADLVVANSAKP